jgi:hypothetical protein
MCPPVTMNNVQIPTATETKYLGLHLDQRLHSLTHSWSRALLEKLPIVQLLKNFSAFYGTRRFITAFT